MNKENLINLLYALLWLLPIPQFNECYVDNDGNPIEGPTRWKAKCFLIEWLGHGVILYIGEVFKVENYN